MRLLTPRTVFCVNSSKADVRTEPLSSIRLCSLSIEAKSPVSLSAVTDSAPAAVTGATARLERANPLDVGLPSDRRGLTRRATPTARPGTPGAGGRDGGAAGYVERADTVSPAATPARWSIAPCRPMLRPGSRSPATGPSMAL